MGMATKKDKKKKGKGKHRPKEEKEIPTTVDGKEIRGIVRISGRDLKGHWKITRAIQAIRGIGPTVGKMLSKIALKELGLKSTILVGELDEQMVTRLEQILSNPKKYGVYDFLLNRQKEFQTNSPSHAISTDLIYAVRQDIEHEKDSQTWKGYRHSYGQKVRGQRTRTTGRTGMTVGVMRKAVKAAAIAAKAEETGKGREKGKPVAEEKPKEKPKAEEKK
ncbi:MAG: 30S ribosomal protein S13 [Candidatus Micrarchaeota archaeon]